MSNALQFYNCNDTENNTEKNFLKESKGDCLTLHVTADFYS